MNYHKQLVQLNWFLYLLRQRFGVYIINRIYLPMKPGFLLTNTQRTKPTGPPYTQNTRQATSNSSSKREDSLNSKIQIPNKRLDPKFLYKNGITQQSSEALQLKQEHRTQTEPIGNPKSQYKPENPIIKIEIDTKKTPEKARIFQDTWNQKGNFLQGRPSETRIITDMTTKRKEENQRQFSLPKGSISQQISKKQQNRQLWHNQSSGNLLASVSQSQPPLTQVDRKLINPNFSALLRLFQPQHQLPLNQLKQSIKFFLRIQIQKVLGHLSEPHAIKFSLKNSQEINRSLIHKHRQVQLLHQILNLFREYISKEFQNNPYTHPLFLRTAEKVWGYLYQQYNQRFKDYTAHCYEMLNRDRHQNQTSAQYLIEYFRQIQNDKIIQRIEELNQLSRTQKKLPKYYSCGMLKESLEELTQKKIYGGYYDPYNFQPSNENDYLSLNIGTFDCRKEFPFIIRGKKMKKHSNKAKQSPESAGKIKVISRIPAKNIPKKQEKTTYQKLTLRLVYNFTIEWLGGADNYEVFLQEEHQTLNTLELSGDPTYEQIYQQLILNLKIKHCISLRSDCEITVSSFKTNGKLRHYVARLIVRQRILNLPNNYYWKVPQWNKQLVAYSLEVGNEFGIVKWNQEIDLRKIDFAKESIVIQDKSLRCQCQQLNKACLVTFYGLPVGIKNKTSNNIQQVFARFISKMGDVALVSIDRLKDKFTVKFNSFWDSVPSKMSLNSPSTAFKTCLSCLD